MTPFVDRIAQRVLCVALLAAIIVAVHWMDVARARADGGWPTTCVALNDIVEAHLGNDGNVGIYQRAYGDQAETGCQGDHRADVQSVFGWALGASLTTSPSPKCHPFQEVGKAEEVACWRSFQTTDTVTGDVTYTVQHLSNKNATWGWMNSYLSPTNIYVTYSKSSGLRLEVVNSMLDRLGNTFKVEYRFDQEPHVSTYWPAYYYGHQPVELRGG